MAMTPRLRSASASVSSLFSAPRSLNEAVNCRFSNLSQTSAPVSSDSVRLCRQGVRSTAPAMRLRGGADVVEGDGGSRRES